MTTGPIAPMTGLQLIYANVEADLSPTRQRGFQIWLCSPELPPDQRRAVAKRLDDFRLPPGSDPADGTVARHCFFRLPPDGPFVIARTVPSAERDKFGRGGKFHAHALVLAADTFGLLGHDPFRVIDGGFRFHASPADAMTGDGWRSGELPRAEFSPAESAGRAPPGSVIPACLAHHADQEDRKPLVISEPPARVLGYLRDWFAVLPPCVRRKVWFDTLSGGTALGEAKYVVVGAYSPDLLKTWPHRQYHRLDVGSGASTPPLATPPTALSAQILADPTWGHLSDAERDGLYTTAQALSEHRLGDLRPEGLTPAGATLLAECEAFGPTHARAVRNRIELDVPAALGLLPEVRDAVSGFLDQPTAEALNRLRQPIPGKVVGAGLLTALTRTPARPPREVIAGLEEWVARVKPSVPRLELVLRRWRMADQDVSDIEHVLAQPDDGSNRARWFRTWLAATMRGTSAGELLARLPVDRPPAPAALAEARLWLALADPAEGGDTAELALVTALHRGPQALDAALTRAASRQQAAGWLVRTTARRLRDRYAAGWADDGLGKPYLGLFLVPERESDHALLDAVIKSGGRRGGWELMNAIWPISNGLTAAPRPDTEPPMTEACKAHYQQILGAATPRKRTEAVAAFRAYLASADDDAFVHSANHLLEKAWGECELCEVTDEVYFAGLRLVWVQRSNQNNQLGLFEAIAGAVVPEVRVGTVPAVGAAGTSRPGRRFNWLMARLCDPVGTQTLRL